jgi:hypothetical protein
MVVVVVVVVMEEKEEFARLFDLNVIIKWKNVIYSLKWRKKK